MDWELHWGRGDAVRRRVMQEAQTKRLLVGDEAFFEDERAGRAQQVVCMPCAAITLGTCFIDTYPNGPTNAATQR